MVSNLWRAFKTAFFFLSTMVIAKIIFKWTAFVSTIQVVVRN